MKPKRKERNPKCHINTTKWIRVARFQLIKNHVLDVRRGHSWQSISIALPVDAAGIPSSNERRAE